MTQKVAYVTGGMGGIGTAICQRLHKDGFKVIAGCGPSRDYAKWLDEQKALGYSFYASVGNVADWDSTVEAFRKGCGPDVGIMLDTNFHFRTEGFRRIAEAVGPTNLTWLELDVHDPKSIALIRRDSPVPIASGETLLERRDFRPYLENYSFDTAIVDVIWNGFAESLKIAAMADVYEVNVAPHNFYGHLASAISAHFCAAVPNFRVMEIDIDSAPWRDEFVKEVPVIDKGDYILPKGPGWGVEVDEAGLKRHPPKKYVVTQ